MATAILEENGLLTLPPSIVKELEWDENTPLEIIQLKDGIMLRPLTGASFTDSSVSIDRGKAEGLDRGYIDNPADFC